MRERCIMKVYLILQSVMEGRGTPVRGRTQERRISGQGLGAKGMIQSPAVTDWLSIPMHESDELLQNCLYMVQIHSEEASSGITIFSMRYSIL